MMSEERYNKRYVRSLKEHSQDKLSYGRAVD